MHRNVVLTGLPRSGTTLSCHLLMTVENTVALHEPIDPRTITHLKKREKYCRYVADFFEKNRVSLLTRGKAISKHVGGVVPDNTGAAERGEHGLRPMLARFGEIEIAKPLTENFTLCIKQNAGFAVHLDLLVARFPCFAMIRNPLATLTSWTTVNIPPGYGRLPAAERWDKKLTRELTEIPGRFDRQIHIMNWFFEKFRTLLPASAIIRYEDLIASRGSVLALVTPHASALQQPLESRNRNPIYDHKLMREMGAKLLERDGAFWDFYAKDDVRQLMDELAAGS